jgi:hypothetical protein
MITYYALLLVMLPQEHVSYDWDSLLSIQITYHVPNKEQYDVMRSIIIINNNYYVSKKWVWAVLFWALWIMSERIFLGSLFGFH